MVDTVQYSAVQYSTVQYNTVQWLCLIFDISQTIILHNKTLPTSWLWKIIYAAVITYTVWTKMSSRVQILQPTE